MILSPDKDLPVFFSKSFLQEEAACVHPLRQRGCIVEVVGTVLKARLCGAATGQFVTIASRADPENKLLAQVTGFYNNLAILSAYGTAANISPGSHVESCSCPPRLHLGPRLLGSVVNYLGAPARIVSESAPNLSALTPKSVPLNLNLQNANYACGISRMFITAIRAIDGFLTLGFGQRIGIFAEPGLGKSTLMRQIAANSSSDVNVIALIGERGREASEFIEEFANQAAMARSIFVVATSDEAAICRVTAAQTAVSIAEYFCEQGMDVLLQLDSLTRLLRAHREVGLSAGELPVRRGYPPSVFAALPALLERMGERNGGSITGVFTVLSSGELDEDPMVEEIRGVTDGHIILSKEMAERGHFPAIDICRSLSRVHSRVAPQELQQASRSLRRFLSERQEERQYGFAASGNNSAQIKESKLLNFLTQTNSEQWNIERTLEELCEIAKA